MNVEKEWKLNEKVFCLRRRGRERKGGKKKRERDERAYLTFPLSPAQVGAQPWFYPSKSHLQTLRKHLITEIVTPHLSVDTDRFASSHIHHTHIHTSNNLLSSQSTIPSHPQVCVYTLFPLSISATLSVVAFRLPRTPFPSLRRPRMPRQHG